MRRQIKQIKYLGSETIDPNRRVFKQVKSEERLFLFRSHATDIQIAREKYKT